MAYQNPQSTFAAGNTAPGVMTALNSNGGQVSNLLLTLRRLIRSGETLTVYSGEELVRAAPYAVQGHVVVQGHVRVMA